MEVSFLNASLRHVESERRGEDQAKSPEKPKQKYHCMAVTQLSAEQMKQCEWQGEQRRMGSERERVRKCPFNL